MDRKTKHSVLRFLDGTEVGLVDVNGTYTEGCLDLGIFSDTGWVVGQWKEFDSCDVKEIIFTDALPKIVVYRRSCRS